MQRANAVGGSPLYTHGLGYAYAAAGNKTRARAVIDVLKQKGRANLPCHVFHRGLDGHSSPVLTHPTTAHEATGIPRTSRTLIRHQASRQDLWKGRNTPQHKSPRNLSNQSIHRVVPTEALSCSSAPLRDTHRRF